MNLGRFDIRNNFSNASAKSPRDPSSGITVLNKQRKIEIDLKAAALFCTGLLQALKKPDCGLSLVFVGSGEIRSVNLRYRGRDYATDVLSFSYGGVKIEGVSFLGEIIIAPAVAVGHAACYGITPEKEIRKLLVHGTLHLLGYDHEMDRGQMNREQAKLMRRKFFFDSPPILQRRNTIR